MWDIDSIQASCIKCDVHNGEHGVMGTCEEGNYCVYFIWIFLKLSRK